MLTEMVEYGCKIEEKMKAMKSEIKENIQGTNSKGKETGTQINGLQQKQEIYLQPEQNEETRIQKNEERLRNLWNDSKCSNIQMQSKIKENVQGTNSEGKETGTQINSLEQREEINIQLEQDEETRIQKIRRVLGTSRTTLNIPTSES